MSSPPPTKDMPTTKASANMEPPPSVFSCGSDSNITTRFHFLTRQQHTQRSQAEVCGWGSKLVPETATRNYDPGSATAKLHDQAFANFSDLMDSTAGLAGIRNVEQLKEISEAAQQSYNKSHATQIEKVVVQDPPLSPDLSLEVTVTSLVSHWSVNLKPCRGNA